MSNPNQPETKLLFALDIGTRSVVGLVGEQTGDTVRLLAYEREEHNTRAMLDGQIHDVPEVAGVLAAVKKRLEAKVGPLKKAAVAAAGRALLTLRSKAEIEITGRGVLHRDDERALELAAIQTAQRQLALSSPAAGTPTGYYCVGYSVVNFYLDDLKLASLVGQRGKSASIEIIATFLPRQVIDSLQSALQTVGLEMATLTLEPIAAINVLIPPTMRHLNLTLVDVGAGTSDVAITSEGSVVGYGMVPCAGDEITEAISQHYLLDFNVAEMVKRQLAGKAKKIIFTDVLGVTHKTANTEILACIKTRVAELGQTIAAQILALNKTAPQAVLLVGGGALTPLLPEALAQALDIPAARVAIRSPETIAGMDPIPPQLRSPDSVTPLGILRLAGGQTLNFVNVTLNSQNLSLFNLGNLAVADALLAGGIDVRSLHGRPGLGITVSVNGETKFLPGSHGQPGRILVNEQEATFADPLQEGDLIQVCAGMDGTSPQPRVGELLTMPQPLLVFINDQETVLQPLLTVNGEPASPETCLKDRDEVCCRLPATLIEILTAAGIETAPTQYNFVVNGTERSYKAWPQYLVNGSSAQPGLPVHCEDSIRITPAPAPKLIDVLGLKEQTETTISVLFNGRPCQVPVKRSTAAINGRSASLTDTIPEGAHITTASFEPKQPMISEVLLAASFDPRQLSPGARIEVRLNERPAEYTALVSEGDRIEITTAD